jgi:hypothetical protein
VVGILAGTALGSRGLLAISMLEMGMALLAYPFTTTTTVSLIGLRNSILVARAAGVAILVAAILQAFVWDP